MNSEFGRNNHFSPVFTVWSQTEILATLGTRSRLYFWSQTRSKSRKKAMIWWAGLDLIGNKFAAYGEIIIWRLLAWSTLDRWVFVGVHVQCLVWSAALHMYAVLNLCGPFARTARPSSYQIIIKLLNCFLSVWNWIIGLVLVSGEWIMHCEHRKGMNGVNGALICPACAEQRAWPDTPDILWLWQFAIPVL